MFLLGNDLTTITTYHRSLKFLGSVVCRIQGEHTVKFLNIRHPKNCCNYTKIRTILLYHGVMSPNDADGMANGVDPDQSLKMSEIMMTLSTVNR